MEIGEGKEFCARLEGFPGPILPQSFSEIAVGYRRCWGWGRMLDLDREKVEIPAVLL